MSPSLSWLSRAVLPVPELSASSCPVCWVETHALKVVLYCGLFVFTHKEIMPAEPKAAVQLGATFPETYVLKNGQAGRAVLCGSVQCTVM